MYWVPCRISYRSIVSYSYFILIVHYLGQEISIRIFFVLAIYCAFYYLLPVHLQQSQSLSLDEQNVLYAITEKKSIKIDYDISIQIWSHPYIDGLKGVKHHIVSGQESATSDTACWPSLSLPGYSSPSICGLQSPI